MTIKIPYRRDTKQLGYFYLIMSGLGYEWKTDGNYTIFGYCPNIGNMTVIRGELNSYFDIFKDSQGKPLLFEHTDAKKVYDKLIEHLQWSPEALAAGTAHENLMAASESFKSAVANQRKTRKTRK